MSIYIKDMEMPKSCAECRFKRYGACIMAGYRSPKMPSEYLERPDWCPLAPVPPHGRLIDADALERDEVYTSEYGFQEVFWVAQIDDAPTIIPAEEGEA